MRTLLFCCLTFVALGSYSVLARDTKEYLEFYPPFVLEDIAKLVQQQQDALDVAQFHTMITVQYGTRIEWINACAWLNAQTEGVMQFYLPAQNGTDESYYFCGISGTYDEASVDSLSAVQVLTNELTRQFGGAITRWMFNFHEYSGRDDSAYMGLTIAKASPELCAELSVARDCGLEGGIIVVAVTGAPARTAGLKKGDILVRLNEQFVSEPTNVVEILGNASPGDPFYATILRGHQEVQITGVFGSRDQLVAVTVAQR